MKHFELRNNLKESLADLDRKLPLKQWSRAGKTNSCGFTEFATPNPETRNLKFTVYPFNPSCAAPLYSVRQKEKLVMPGGADQKGCQHCV